MLKYESIRELAEAAQESGQKISELVLAEVDDEECEMIHLTGNLKVEDLEMLQNLDEGDEE